MKFWETILVPIEPGQKECPSVVSLEIADPRTNEDHTDCRCQLPYKHDGDHEYKTGSGKRIINWGRDGLDIRAGDGIPRKGFIEQRGAEA